jgi:hypothetical protein
MTHFARVTSSDDGDRTNIQLAIINHPQSPFITYYHQTLTITSQATT